MTQTMTNMTSVQKRLFLYPLFKVSHCVMDNTEKAGESRDGCRYGDTIASSVRKVTFKSTMCYSLKKVTNCIK